jgi:hypothetical protein
MNPKTRLQAMSSRRVDRPETGLSDLFLFGGNKEGVTGNGRVVLLRIPPNSTRITAIFLHTAAANDVELVTALMASFCIGPLGRRGDH